MGRTSSGGTHTLGGSLEHYGVKGMKWGVRRTPAQLAAAAKARGSSEDAKRAAVLKKQARKGGVSTLSNDELRELNKRLELESKYKQWAAKNPTLKQRAVGFVSKQLAEVGKDLVKDLTPMDEISAVLKTGIQTRNTKKRSPSSSSSKPSSGSKPQSKTRTDYMKPNPNYKPGKSPISGGDVQVHNITTLRNRGR